MKFGDWPVWVANLVFFKEEFSSPKRNIGKRLKCFEGEMPKNESDL